MFKAICDDVVKFPSATMSNDVESGPASPGNVVQFADLIQVKNVENEGPDPLLKFYYALLKYTIYNNPPVTLLNPWTGVPCREMTWPDIMKWAEENIHARHVDEWLDDAAVAFDEKDGHSLGRMVIGS